MELARKETLEQVIKEKSQGFSEDKLMLIFANLCLALHEIHSKKVQHRDFKPSNILIRKYNQMEIYKIADFGLSKYN